MFRTISGQTGTDAYIYEAAQIGNALRELNARTERLANAMADELGDQIVQISMASPEHPDHTRPTSGDSLRARIRFYPVASNAEYLARIARGMRDPEYIVHHV